jgi:8-oxo-dGTP pyrophosphatase MutT (NUDIX family)
LLELPKKDIYCGNCGNKGHGYRRCLQPIISLGVILFRKRITNETQRLEYLMVQRRDTLGYVEFMRGKYNLENSQYIYSLFRIMTESERKKLLNYEFDFLWRNLWMNKNLKKFQNEYNNSKKKFNLLKRGITINDQEMSLLKMHQEVDIIWTTPEWGFPKGRRNHYESDLECAVREFEEESGYTKADYKIIDELEPVIELFLGTNNIRYKHIYYIGESVNDTSLTINKNNFYQASEISKIKWFSFEQAHESIRVYNNEKRAVLIEVNNILTKKYL